MVWTLSCWEKPLAHAANRNTIPLLWNPLPSHYTNLAIPALTLIPRGNFSTRKNAEQKSWTFIIIIFLAVWNKNRINIRVNVSSKIRKKLKPQAQRRLGRTGRRLRFFARHALLYLTLSHIPSPTVVINLNYKNPLNLMWFWPCIVVNMWK
jgi:hypothetical protein